MDQVWKGLSNLDPRDPGGFYKKPLLSPKLVLVYAEDILCDSRLKKLSWMQIWMM